MELIQENGLDSTGRSRAGGPSMKLQGLNPGLGYEIV